MWGSRKIFSPRETLKKEHGLHMCMMLHVQPHILRLWHSPKLWSPCWNQEQENSAGGAPSLVASNELRLVLLGNFCGSSAGCWRCFLVWIVPSLH